MTIDVKQTTTEIFITGDNFNYVYFPLVYGDQIDYSLRMEGDEDKSVLALCDNIIDAITKHNGESSRIDCSGNSTILVITTPQKDTVSYTVDLRFGEVKLLDGANDE